MDTYSYDIFFSYKRDAQSNDWHQQVHDKLAFWVKKELGTTHLRTFFDVEAIATGDRWKEKIEAGLKASKCIVCMWSPDYFQSRWCMSEFRSFVARENMLAWTAGGLIVPAAIHDGDSFPQDAKDYQLDEFNVYFATMPYFWNSQDAWDFEKKKLKAFARHVASRLRKAPPFQADFPIELVPESAVPPPAPIQRVSDQAA